MEQDVLNQILHELRELKSDISELKSGQQKLESNIAILSSRQDETHQIVKAIHHRQDVSDSKLDALKEEHARQGRALEVLSARSIEHEAELKRVL